MYLENNLNKIKNNFPDIYNKYQKFFKYIANKEKDNINYEILSSKVDHINFHKTLCNYLNYLLDSSAEETSIKDKLFLKDLSKGPKRKSAYSTTNGENNIEKTYDDLVLNDKKIDDIFYKKSKKGD